MTDKKKLSREELEREVEKIGEYISQAKVEMAAISLSEQQSGNDKNIAHATLELNEVIRHTEEATNTIMDAAEKIMGLSADAGKAGGPLNECAMNIMEACSFQDITGQRIRKVLKTLDQIELRVGNLIKLFGGKLPENLSIGEIETAPRRADEELMNGPQLSGEGTSQADVDKLFGG
jgi:chemotaxis protein CheZ